MDIKNKVAQVLMTVLGTGWEAVYTEDSSGQPHHMPL